MVYTRGMGRYTAEETARRARDVYERSIRAEVEGVHDGRFLVVDVESGEYEVADDALSASDRLRERRPEAVLYLMRVGRPAAFRLGGRSFLEPTNRGT